MKTIIALFRGINVGGNNLLPMKDLVALLNNLGFERVHTYLQSGNAVFKSENDISDKLSNIISSRIRDKFGFEPKILLVDLGHLEMAIATNPFSEAESEPKNLHLFFLEAAPHNPDMKTLNSIKDDNEQFRLVGKVFYLHTPSGLGKSKLAGRVEKLLGVAATARNWRSVCEIMLLAKRTD